MSSIDVIVPCYNYARFLRECVESVLTQTGPAVRVLILDDASLDETPAVAAELVSKDARVTFVRHEQNKGHIATYNEGIEWLSSDYYLLLSADDYLLPTALSKAVTLLDEDPAIGFVFGNAIVIYDDGSHDAQKPFGKNISMSSAKILDANDFIKTSRSRNIVPTPTAVVRTKLQKKLGGYNPNFPHAGDMEMWLRLAAHGKVAFIDRDQAAYRKHSANMSNAYYGTSMLPDLQQRLAVLQSFFRENSRYLREPAKIHNDCLRWLAQDALGFANVAFSHGNKDLSVELTALSLSMFPNVKWSRMWWKLVTKKIVGPKVWKAVRSFDRGKKV